MLSLVRAFARDESGAVATEYAFLIIFIALAIVAGITVLGNGLNNLFSDIGSFVNGKTTNV
jgi:pilus assembly protein Flp/PilA